MLLILHVSHPHVYVLCVHETCCWISDSELCLCAFVRAVTNCADNKLHQQSCVVIKVN